jgi:hypothetical protein
LSTAVRPNSANQRQTPPVVLNFSYLGVKGMRLQKNPGNLRASRCGLKSIEPEIRKRWTQSQRSFTMSCAD